VNRSSVCSRSPYRAHCGPAFPRAGVGAQRCATLGQHDERRFPSRAAPRPPRVGNTKHTPTPKHLWGCRHNRKLILRASPVSAVRFRRALARQRGSSLTVLPALHWPSQSALLFGSWQPNPCASPFARETRRRAASVPGGAFRRRALFGIDLALWALGSHWCHAAAHQVCCVGGVSARRAYEGVPGPRRTLGIKS
jgi:hypothetical protein